MAQTHPPSLLVFDSGLGGLSVLRALREAIPSARINYLADTACFPYGTMDDDTLSTRVYSVLARAVARFAPDAIVIACNTASTIALPALRATFEQPVIGTVPAVKPAAHLSHSGLISVLGTVATVQRDYTRALIAEYGRGKYFTLIGAIRLASLAEAAMMGETVSDSDIWDEIAPCFIEAEGQRTDVIVLACTHYPLLLDRMEALAPWPVTWLDPAPSIARHTANILTERGFCCIGTGPKRNTEQIIFTSGKAVSPALKKTLERYGLTLAKDTQNG